MIRETHARGYLLRFPYAVHETCGASVERVWSVVDGQLVVFPGYLELTVRDAVGVASGNLAEAGAVGEI